MVFVWVQQVFEHHKGGIRAPKRGSFPHQRASSGLLKDFVFIEEVPRDLSDVLVGVERILMVL